VIPSLESIDWHNFLARPPLPSPTQSTITALTRSPILITGAGGSIGSALALHLASVGARLILLESSESSLFDLQSRFADFPSNHELAFYLGSVANRSLLDEIFALHSPRLVYHAAAFKHVPLIEEQPLAAVANNIFATQTLAAAASPHKARVILLSTDKAVAPASVMGATKRVAEQIVLLSGGTVLRLGNVLASRGSVTEVFARQIAASLPLTVTDPAARRYFLTLSEAVDQLIAAASASAASSLLVPNLRSPHFIADLARFMVRNLAPAHDVAITFTHLRAGDKETEQLWSATETPHPVAHDGLIQIETPLFTTSQLNSHLERLHTALLTRDLNAALACLRSLVPDYTPSSTVRDLRSSAISAITNE
jgi:FlaA1/EpsC-like NDP-sugar epimerase